MAAMTAMELTKGWEFTQTGSEEWLPVARVPTNVHLDLMDNKESVHILLTLALIED